jgi:hypothetical protein
VEGPLSTVASRRLIWPAGLATAAALLVAGAPAAAPRPETILVRKTICVLPRGAAKLPVQAIRGLHNHLHDYPSPAAATPAQRAAAERLLARIRRESRRWRDPRRAAADGFELRHERRAPGDRSIGFLHAERRRTRTDGYLDVRRPKAIIYANAAGRPLVLVGVMFSVPRGGRGPTPGGPITRWHWHEVCVRGGKRGLRPRDDGSCPAGSSLQQGSEMMHVWLTNDLRSAFAIHAPRPELCAAGRLPAERCRAAVGERARPA